MFLLPSLFTAGSIGAGYFAITQTIDAVTRGGKLTARAIWTGRRWRFCFAIPFDALDGRIARMTNTTSDFGKELDSLADAITFGVAPCLLAWVWGLSLAAAGYESADCGRRCCRLGRLSASCICSAGLRGWRGSISATIRSQEIRDGMDRKYFVGMPIPAAAGMMASTVHFCYGYPIPNWPLAVLWIGMVGLLGFLMVSTWRFWSGKEINFGRRQPFQLLVVLAIVVFVLIRFSSGVLFFVALAYMFSGIWARAAYSWSRRRRQMPREELTGSGGTELDADGSGVYQRICARRSGRVVEYEEFAPSWHPRFEDEEDDSRQELKEDSRPDGY